ncbi:hypothetical protein SeMB42_g06773 [Synchytrium endobioticum]|uniref:Uncharacterized protein n=1 Tax=Synchytrium endobioticum TaxID=286115 RepID=A0A507CJI8_9FUNG|nr:hypothetical protein SeMB42_g06773 [Synchytrium endobioticum]
MNNRNTQSGRPLTSKADRLHDDEAMARKWQDEEDQRIARKLQNDLDMGLDPSGWKLYQSRPQTMANTNYYNDGGNDHDNGKDDDNNDRLGQDSDFTKNVGGGSYRSDELDFRSKPQASPLMPSSLYDGASTPHSSDPALSGQRNSVIQHRSAMQQLLAYVSSYHPETIELETVLRPFIPEYIAAIPDPDPMLKIPKPGPDSQQQGADKLDLDSAPLLGLTVLDEPHIKQSDAAALSLQLRALQKSFQDNGSMTSIKSIHVPIATPSGRKMLQSWVNSMHQMHIKPSEVVAYSKRMPDIEELMQRFPSRLVDVLAAKTSLANVSHLDLDLRELSRLCLALLDVPLHPGRSGCNSKTRHMIESLHVLFSLYLEFAEHGHFGHART